MSSPSIDVVYQRYFPAVREKCRRLVQDHAEAQDLAQDAFIRLWKAGVFRDGDDRKSLAFVFRTATRLGLDHVRRQANWGRLVDQMPEAPLPPKPDQALEHRRALETVIASLSREELEIVILHRIDRLTQREVAEVMGNSERTVRRALTRMDERLAALRAGDLIQ